MRPFASTIDNGEHYPRDDCLFVTAMVVDSTQVSVEMPEIPFYIVDAFASKAFEGNPAAVCILPPDHSKSDEWMQNVAAEINLSETAFVIPETQSLRWFTPAAEVDLCGHATVATAAALLDAGRASVGDVLRFQTRSGGLSAELTSGNQVSLNFPSTPPEELVEADQPNADELKSLLGEVVFLGKSRFDLLVELTDEQAVQAFEPNFAKMKEWKFRGIMITAESAREDVDFVSRFFAPAVGVDEDPVTGSAHCCLTPYWARKLKKSSMNASQLSRRGGQLQVELKEDSGKGSGTERVLLQGNSVVVVKGILV